MATKSTAENLLLGKKLFDEGYGSLSSLNNAMQAMENVEVSDESISRALAMIIRSHAKLQGSAEGQTWNVENFVKAALNKVFRAHVYILARIIYTFLF
jgi:hypothetical protein